MRTLLGQQRRTVFSSNSLFSGFKFCGGLQLYLDLTRAFDCVWRQLLFQHLYDLSVPAALYTLISSWHQDTHYNLSYEGKTVQIPVGVGLRQGCKAGTTVVGDLHE